MPRVITVSNNKGGVAKTTTAACIAALLREMGGRVLLMDVDGAPSNLSLYVRADKDAEGMWQLLSMEEPTEDDVLACIQPAGEFGDIVAADGSVNVIEPMLDGRIAKEHILERAIDTIKRHYDYFVIDTPPTWCNRVVNAIVAADDVIVPTTADESGAASAIEFTAAVAKTRRLMGRMRQHDMEIAGILVGRWRSTAQGGTRLEMQYDARIRAYAQSVGMRVFDTRIRATDAVGRSQASGVPIFMCEGRSTAAADYRSAVDEYLRLPGRNLVPWGCDYGYVGP